MRKKEEEFSRQTTVVQTVLSVELDHQPLLQVIGSLTHDLRIRIFEDMSSSNLDVALTRNWSKSRLRSKVDELPSEISLVLRHIEL